MKVFENYIEDFLDDRSYSGTVGYHFGGSWKCYHYCDFGTEVTYARNNYEDDIGHRAICQQVIIRDSNESKSSEKII
jgi:hypothetical protein